MNFLGALRTRVVILLLRLADAEHGVAERLKPVVDVRGEAYVLVITDLGAVSTAVLGDRVASLEEQRQIVVDALEFLFLGF